RPPDGGGRHRAGRRQAGRPHPVVVGAADAVGVVVREVDAHLQGERHPGGEQRAHAVRAVDGRCGARAGQHGGDGGREGPDAGAERWGWRGPRVGIVSTTTTARGAWGPCPSASRSASSGTSRVTTAVSSTPHSGSGTPTTTTSPATGSSSRSTCAGCTLTPPV